MGWGEFGRSRCAGTEDGLSIDIEVRCISDIPDLSKEAGPPNVCGHK